MTARPAGAGIAGFAVFCWLLALTAVVGCGQDQRPARQTFLFEGETMGTTYRVKVVHLGLDGERVQILAETVAAELEDTNTSMSTYIESSELMRFNRASPKDPFELSQSAWEIFSMAQEVSRRTGGAFDVTVGPLVNAWGFGPGSEVSDTLPEEISDEELAVLRQRVGFEKLTLADGPRTVIANSEGVFCDLSAIAKGYGVDQVAKALMKIGEHDFMIEVGGEVRASGRNAQGTPWRIGIERPETATRGSVQLVVPLTNAALATSGNYRIYREVRGQRVAHILDPRSGRPITHRLASVSVVDERCAMADALATGLYVMGPEEGYTWAVAEEVAAVFLVREDKSFREIRTPAFEALLAGDPAYDPGD
jgi:thiamine biosynthesis lipoprotein